MAVLVAGATAFWPAVAACAEGLNEARTPAPAPAESGGGLTVDDVEVGFGGAFKVGEWTRLRLAVGSAVARRVTLIIEAPDGDDNLAVLVSRPFELDAG